MTINVLDNFFGKIFFSKKREIVAAAGVFAAVIFTACQTDKSEIIQKQVAERVTKYRAEQLTEHRQKLLDEASRMVDSLLLDEARTKLQDSLGHVRPFKPGKPEAIPPIDSAVVKPLF